MSKTKTPTAAPRYDWPDHQMALLPEETEAEPEDEQLEGEKGE